MDTVDVMPDLDASTIFAINVSRRVLTLRSDLLIHEAKPSELLISPFSAADDDMTIDSGQGHYRRNRSRSHYRCQYVYTVGLDFSFSLPSNLKVIMGIFPRATNSKLEWILPSGLWCGRDCNPAQAVCALRHIL